MKLSAGSLRKMAIEYEGLWQQMLENLEYMAKGSLLESQLTKLADEHSRRFASLVEIFYDPDREETIILDLGGSDAYKNFTDSISRMHIMMKPSNLESLLRTLKTVKLIYAFAHRMERTAGRIYKEVADAIGDNPVRLKFSILSEQSFSAATDLQELVKTASNDPVDIVIIPLPEETSKK